MLLLVSNLKKISKFTFDSLFIILYTSIRSECIRLSSSDHETQYLQSFVKQKLDENAEKSKKENAGLENAR